MNHSVRNIMIFLFSQLIMMAVQPNAYGRNHADGSLDYECGALSLAVILHLEGFETEFKNVVSALGAGSENGHSMRQLVSAARQLGIQLRGYQIGVNDWPLPGPAIAHFDYGGKGHFVVIRPVGSKGRLVQIIDAARCIEIKEFSQLNHSPEWTGHVLMVDPISARRSNGTCIMICSMIIIVLMLFAPFRAGMHVRLRPFIERRIIK